jgi:hypothetical protein
VLELRKGNESVSIMICANFRTLLQSVGNFKKVSCNNFSTVEPCVGKFMVYISSSSTIWPSSLL